MRKAEEALEDEEWETALVCFNKVIFYDKKIPEVYVEKAEIFIKICDFSSAIQCFKKALLLTQNEQWSTKMNQLYFMKGLTLIEEGYCNDALNLVSTLESDDIKFTYLKALAYIRAANKDLAFAELEKATKKDPNNIEVIILKGKLLWSIDQIDKGNEMFWLAHDLDPNHHEVIEFLSI